MSIALALVVFIAFSVEATAGFGSIMISLALGTLIWPIGELLPVVVPSSLGLSCYLLMRYGRAANWRLLLRVVLPVMGVGTAVGMFLVPSASPDLLRLMLGVVVIGAAVHGLLSMRNDRRAPRGASIASLIWMLVAGVVHGMIATGGPALVYALEGAGMDKRSFRSTLAVVWVVLNVILTVSFVSSGALGTEQVRTLSWLLPVVAVALLAGEFLHSRVSETIFRGAVFSLLVATGFLLAIPALLSWL
jgi:uncharacterized protein